MQRIVLLATAVLLAALAAWMASDSGGSRGYELLEGPEGPSTPVPSTPVESIREPRTEVPFSLARTAGESAGGSQREGIRVAPEIVEVVIVGRVLDAAGPAVGAETFVRHPWGQRRRAHRDVDAEPGAFRIEFEVHRSTPYVDVLAEHRGRTATVRVDIPDGGGAIDGLELVLEDN